jgi:acetyltransferase
MTAGIAIAMPVGTATVTNTGDSPVEFESGDPATSRSQKSHGIPFERSEMVDPPEPAIRPYPAQYSRPWKFEDGQEVLIRPIRPEDEPLIVTFHG